MNPVEGMTAKDLSPEMVKFLVSSNPSLFTPKLGVVDSEGGMLVQPEPGFVVKTFENEDSESQPKNSQDALAIEGEKGAKVFINICGSKDIEKIHSRSMAEGEACGGEEALRIPLSIGELIEDADKAGVPCRRVDVLINSETLTKSFSDALLKSGIVDFAVLGIEQKYKLRLQTPTVLKMKYKGELPPRIQRIRVQKLSQIEEVQDETKIDQNKDAEKREAIERRKKEILDKMNENNLEGLKVSVAYLYSTVESEGVPPQGSYTLDGFELPLMEAGLSVGGFKYAKAFQDPEKEKKQKEERNDALGSIEGSTWRAEIKMENLHQVIPQQASKLFTVTICDEGVRIIWNRLPSMLFIKNDSASIGSSKLVKNVKNPPYNPLKLWFPRCISEAADNASIWWNIEERILIIDVPIPDGSQKRKASGI